MTERSEVFLAKASPLSITQERFWVLDRLHPGSAAQIVARGLRWTHPIDQRALQTTLDDLLQQHEILRTKFHAVDGAPEQVVLSPPPPTLNTVDLRHLPQEERETQLLRLAHEETRTPFDLSQSPLFRVRLFQLSDAEQVLLLAAHRIVCDETSLELLLSDLSAGYQARARGESPEAAETPLQYREFASWEAAPSEAQLSYWKNRLEGAPASIDLPTDRPRPAVPTFRVASQRLWIEAPLLERLRAMGEGRGATLFSTLLAAFNILLSRYSKQDDLVVGTRISGRGRPELQRLIGPLENMLALHTDVSGEPSFVDLLARVQEVTQGAFSRPDVPFEALVKQLHLERDLSRHPIFQITFTLHDVAALPPFPAGMSLLMVESATQQFDLSVELVVKENKLETMFRYDPNLFDASTIERMAGHFRTLLESAAENPGVRISRMPLLTAAERQQLLVDWNDTRIEYPLDVPLHKFIEDQVEKTPDAVAVVYESEQLTYKQLNSRANQLAHRLKKSGVGPDILVAVCAERSLELVIALLSILKAGGAYVPFDPEYPKDRLETMLQDSDPPVVLTQVHLLDRLPNGAHSVFSLDRDWPSLQSESTDNLPVSVHQKNLAYAIYTSGSTGQPKGVPNVHEGIVNRLLWMQDMYQLTGKDRVLQKTPFSFDVSVWEFFWPLMTGATLVVARPGGHRDPAYLVNLIAEQGITTLHFVPSMLNIFLETAGLERCRSLRQVFASGEALPFELQQRFFDRLGAELHNLYGPTEAAVDVTYWACHPDSERSIVPIGRPIANTQIYILDANLQPVPIGVAGELHIGGIGLARGYLNRPGLTAERFIPDPFSKAPGAHLYKTGDLARFLVDGNIEYLGRIDHQVKLRGFRIELGEIEAVLGECSGVMQAAVIVREDNPGDKRLVAYLIATPGKKLEVEVLRSDLKDKLPEYMVPARFVMLEAFPMTTSGKVDRKALPAAPLEGGTGTTVVAPRNQLESLLASLFASVLGLPSVGVTDNFFDLGGHSLLAGRLLARVHEVTGKQIPLSALFRGATVESMARLIEQEPEMGLDPVAMEIQRGDRDCVPFFAIVPPGEESLGYAILARHMGPNQPVYKIQGHAPIMGEHPYTAQQLQSMAEEYVTAMRRVRPEGPYCLGGLCGGVHIGERVVVELETQGQEVALFASIDTWVFQHSQRPWMWRAYYYQERLRELSSRSLAEQLRHYKRAAANFTRRVIGKAPARTEWQEAYFPGNYVPTRFRAPVILFKRPKQPFYYVKDPQMGWGARTTTGVEIHEIDFDHLHLLREPHVAVLGKELADCVQRLGRQNAQARESEERFISDQPLSSSSRSG